MEAFLDSEAGVALMSAFGAAVAFGLRAALRWINDKVKGTPTKLDDKMLAAARKALDERETK